MPSSGPAGTRHAMLGVMTTSLDLAAHLDVIRASASTLAEYAAEAGFDAPVPTCSDWTVADLVAHQGLVHRWSAWQFHKRGPEPRDHTDYLREIPLPKLLDWFAEGAGEVIGTLESAPDDAEAMVFLKDAPPPRRFWARRQAFETTIHSADALAARLGRRPTSAEIDLPPEVALDGVDELVCGFVTRGKKPWDRPSPLIVTIAPDDSDRRWTLTIGERITTEPGSADDADATLSGTAAGLLLGLWNRGDEITVGGPPGVLGLWRERSRISWS